MSTVQVFGIPNCSSVKKAIENLKLNGHSVHFHDFKKSGVPLESLSEWIKHLSLEAIVNKKGTTWRGLSADIQAQLSVPASAPALLIQYPSVIKRPVVFFDGKWSVGRTDFSGT